jgi:hypothetical protein
MLDHALQDLRRELAARDRGRGKRYPVAVRDRAVVWARKQRGGVVANAAKLGLHAETLRKWLTARPSRAVANALVPVQVIAEPAMRRLSVVSPAGFRVDGLTVDEAAMLLRAVG